MLRSNAGAVQSRMEMLHMANRDISRRSFLAAGFGLATAQLLAGTGCSSTQPAQASDVLIERNVPGKSVIWQSHATSLEDAAKMAPTITPRCLRSALS